MVRSTILARTDVYGSKAVAAGSTSSVGNAALVNVDFGDELHATANSSSKTRTAFLILVCMLAPYANDHLRLLPDGRHITSQKGAYPA
jgi:hypothetical protein